jgi:hypothetical protein
MSDKISVEWSDAPLHIVDGVYRVEMFHLQVTQVFGVVVNTLSSALCNEESSSSIPSTSDSFYKNSNKRDFVRRECTTPVFPNVKYTLVFLQYHI